MGTFVLRLSTQLDENIISTFQTTNLFLYKYQQLMLQFNSNNQFVSSYFNDNKKQSTFVNSSCHFLSNVNHLRSTSTYTSYFLLLFFVTKYYKSVVYVGGDSVKSDQTFICRNSRNCLMRFLWSGQKLITMNFI